jgi:BirA family biotin operon repressor/biotin-[acetyl-CoA-carboxylase] ligase
MSISQCGLVPNRMFLQSELPGFTIVRRYASLGSTMDEARNLLQEQPPTESSWSAIIYADEQTAGRGRQGRSWITSAGALMATYVFTTEVAVSALAGYSLAVGVAVSRVLERYGITNRLKWPNDIVVVESARTLRKLGGILVEVHDSARYRCVLVGLGLNVTAPPEQVRDIAVGMHELQSEEITAAELIEPIGAELLVMHRAFCSYSGFRGMRKEWTERACFVPGQSTVQIDIGELHQVKGTFVGVDESGALLLAQDGALRTFLSGHITGYELGAGV